MNFEVNDKTYFLAFNGDEGEWMLLTPAMDGFDRLEVYNDDSPASALFVPDSTPEDRRRVN